MDETLSSLARSLGRSIGSVKREVDRRIGKTDIPQIVPYRGYANTTQAHVSARVLRNPGLTPAIAGEAWWRNLLNTYKRIETDEVPNARVRVSGFGSTAEIRADSEGFLRLTLPVKEVDRKSTRLNSSHSQISYAVFCLKKKKRRSDALVDRVPLLACVFFFILRRAARSTLFPYTTLFRSVVAQSAEHLQTHRDRRSAQCAGPGERLWQHGRNQGGQRGLPSAHTAREGSRSEEHTSELQSQSNLVCRLLLEKKKKTERRTRRSRPAPRVRILFHPTARREIYTLSLHDALPICGGAIC